MKMKGDIFIQLDDCESENENNLKIEKDQNNKSFDEQNSFNNQLIKSFQSKEIRNTFKSIFDSYFQSGFTNLKNCKKSSKSDKVTVSEIDLMDLEIE